MPIGVHVLKNSGDVFIRVANLLQIWTNLFHCAQIFGVTFLLAHLIGQAKNGRAKPTEASGQQTTDSIAFCSLLPK